MRPDLQALLERVKGASGADRALDGAVWQAATGLDALYPNPYLDRAEGQHAYAENAILHPVPPITGSIDAALSLVERVAPQFDVEVYIDRRSKSICNFWVDSGEPLLGMTVALDGHAATPPLAIIAALLKAPSAGEPT